MATPSTPVSPYTDNDTPDSAPTAAERKASRGWAQWELRDEGQLLWNDITGEVIWTTEDVIYRLKPGATPPIAPPT